MNIRQAVKMAWKSILGKKGRSMLTMLGVIIGIAAVMTIVSVMSGMAQMAMAQFEAMGTNRLTVEVYNWMVEYDESGNILTPIKDYYPDISAYCKSIPELVVGVTPEKNVNATIVYGTKSNENMEYEYDDNWNLISGPPSAYYGSEQYSLCNNLTVSKGRDLTVLDLDNFNQVCVMGFTAATLYFGSAEPVGKTLQVNGQNFDVVGVYNARMDPNAQGGNSFRLDNFILFPYTASRTLGGRDSTWQDYTVKVRDADSMAEATTRIGGYLKGIVDQNTGGAQVYSDSQWQQQESEYLGMIGAVLGGIAGISLLVGGIGIMNIMLVTVTERTREIGIRRAIGAQRSSIVTQFLIEAAMLCGIGGVIGILIGTLGCYILGRLLFQMIIYPSAEVTAGAFGFSVLLGLIFGSYPAIKASKLQPVEALRAD